MGAVIVIAIIVVAFIALALYAIFRISSEESRWEENYRNKKVRKNEKIKGR